MKPWKIALIGCTDTKLQSILNSNSQNVKIDLFNHHSELGNSNYSIIFISHEKNDLMLIEALPSIKAKCNSSHLIILSKGATPHDVAQAFRLGACDFIFTPYEEEIILTALDRFHFSKIKEEKKWWQNIFNFSKKKELATAHFAPPNLINVQAPHLQFQLFGNLKLIVNGKGVEIIARRQVKSLLAFLLYNYPKPVHREILMEKFWGDKSPESARNCLNVTICSIRRSIAKATGGDDLIIYENECYGIRSDLQVERDLDYFEAYWKKGQQIELNQGIEAAMNTYHQAFAFYRNDLLEDLPYEEWTESARGHYREIWLYILDRLGNHFMEKGKYQLCEKISKQMLEKDPCLENIHRRLMKCFMKMGMRSKAIKQFKKCIEILKRELNAEPSQATVLLMKQIKAT